MRAALYARVSTDEQVEGYSIDAQLRASRDLAHQRGWVIVEEYVDEGKSARVEDIDKRPKFKEMLKAARDKQFDVLIVHKLDRFSRNVIVTLKSFEELWENGITFISITEQMDFTTPIGKVFLAIVGAFADFVENVISAIPSILRTETFVNLRIYKGQVIGLDIEQLVSNFDASPPEEH